MLWIMGRFGAVPEMEWRSQRYARAGWCFSASKAPDRRKKSEFRPIFDQIWLLNQTLDATFVFRDATFVFRRKHDLTFAKVSSTFVSKVCLTFGKTFAKVCLMVTDEAGPPAARCPCRGLGHAHGRAATLHCGRGPHHAYSTRDRNERARR